MWRSSLSERGRALWAGTCGPGSPGGGRGACAVRVTAADLPDELRGGGKAGTRPAEARPRPRRGSGTSPHASTASPVPQGRLQAAAGRRGLAGIGKHAAGARPGSRHLRTDRLDQEGLTGTPGTKEGGDSRMDAKTMPWRPGTPRSRSASPWTRHGREAAPTRGHTGADV